MAKWRTRKTASAGAPPMGTEAVLEKKQDKATEKGGRDAPAEEVVISVPVLHCEGCARKVRRSVQRLEGVEEVIVDCWTNTVVVRGRKAVEDPAKVVEIVERRTGKKAVILSPSPAKLPPSPVKCEDTKKDAAEEDMKKEKTEEDMIEYQEMVVVLRIDLHCDACSEEIKRRILKRKGVVEAVPHMKSSQLMVKGMVEPATLAGFIHKCTGRKAAIVRAEPLDLPPPSKSPPPVIEAETPADAETKQQDPSDNQEEKKEGEEEEKKGYKEITGEEKKRTNEGNGVEEEKTHVDVPNIATNGVVEESHTKDHQFKVPVPAAAVAVAPESEKMAMNSLYQYYYHPANTYAYPYQYQYPQLYSFAGNLAMYPRCAPQTFSDENPNACTVM